MINKNRLIKLTQHLIMIDSQNPPGNESRIAHFIKDYFYGFGLKCKLYEFKKNRANAVVIIKGRKNRRSLLLTPHLDTVPAGRSWKMDPFGAHIYKDRIYGLGATDCKGNLACGIEAIQSIIEDGVTLNYDLIFAASADEETGSVLGLIPLLKKGIIKPDAAVVLDSDEFNIIITQKGLLHVKVRLEGRRAHGAYPWRGVNAIESAVGILRELKEHKFSHTKNTYLRPPTLNIGTIRGGDKVNIVADWCEFELDYRFLPGMQAERIIRQIRKIIRKHSRSFSIKIEALQSPYCIERSHALIRHLSAAMKRLKVKPLIKGSEGATTITFFQKKRIPAIATGFGSKGCAHIADEYVKKDNLYRGAGVLEEFLRSYYFA